jgi:hypothetical protein
MRSSTLIAGLLVLIGCMTFSQEAKGQYVWGYSSIYYDNSTHYVTATSTTELDYVVQEYYKARVNSKITDENGIVLVSGYATDNLQSGYVSVTLQAWNTTAEEFEVVGTHFGIATLYDYVSGFMRYRDFYDYTSLAGFAYDYLSNYGFLGPGPERRTTGSLYQVGKTHSFDQAAAIKVELTAKTDGTIVSAPENEDYEAEKAKAGTDKLGPLPMGEGRADYLGRAYTAPMLMIGQVTPSSAYSDAFKWTRVRRYRSWYIRKSADGSKWIVTQRTRFPADPDQPFNYVDDSDLNGSTSDSTPSSTGKIYMYDNSAMAPADGNGNALAVGDFIREEKAFFYTVRFFDQVALKWPLAGSMHIGQIITVKRKATTGVVADDWQGIENSNAPRILDSEIKEIEVRVIVGGNFPIVIDASVNR